MNKRMIVYILGKMLGVEGAVLLIPALVSLIYHEKSGFSFLIVSAVLGVAASLLAKFWIVWLNKTRKLLNRSGIAPLPIRLAAAGIPADGLCEERISLEDAFIGLTGKY